LAEVQPELSLTKQVSDYNKVEEWNDDQIAKIRKVINEEV
jgi:hypothetical protein